MTSFPMSVKFFSKMFQVHTVCWLFSVNFPEGGYTTKAGLFVHFLINLKSQSKCTTSECTVPSTL